MKHVCEDNLHTFELLKDAPPQIISGTRTFTAALKQNPIGVLEVPVPIGNSVEWWIFDTGANESSVTASAAKRLGLKLSWAIKLQPRGLPVHRSTEDHDHP